MGSRSRWLLWGTLGLAAGAGALGLAFALLVPGDEEIAARISTAAQEKLGVPVTVGQVHWQLFPPALVVEDAATVQDKPISFHRLVAQPSLASLLQGKPAFDHVLIDGGVLPQLSLRALHVTPAPAGSAMERPVAQLRFRNLTWITRHGIPLEFDGNVLFDPGWRPREAQLERPGVQPAARMDVAREGLQDRWQVLVQVGGGTANGEVEITTQADGMLRLAGKLAPRGIEVHNALDAFKRRSAVRGKASGTTLLDASGKTVGDLARSLHTRTNFSIAKATLLHLDLDKAIRTVGQDRAGTTPLQSLSGQMDTQNTPQGIVVRYSAIQARGETFSATGGGTIANRQVDGEVKVVLAGGLVAVPLKIDGPLDKPHVTVTPVAVVQAAVGGVGAAIGRLFGRPASR